MPRIREVKPEFFLDEQLAELSHAARLLFIGLWTLCDREGRLEDRPARIKAQVFPYGQEDVDALLSELASHSGAFVRRYEVEGKPYLEVRSFRKHQRPHPKETPSKLPSPPLSIRAVERNGEPRKDTASRESRSNQVDPSGGSMGTWAHGSMGHGIPAPSAPAPPVPASWSREACDDWMARYGGTAPGGQIGKALKPLVAKHGWPEVREAWRSYLEQSEAEFASASRFASTFGRWSGTSPPGAKTTVAERTVANLEKWVAGKEGKS